MFKEQSVIVFCNRELLTKKENKELDKIHLLNYIQEEDIKREKELFLKCAFVVLEGKQYRLVEVPENLKSTLVP